MGEKGSTFVKGGFGCLAAFLVLGLLAVLFGGGMHINLGGAVLLFVVGGGLALIGLMLFGRKGRPRGSGSRLEDRRL